MTEVQQRVRAPEALSLQSAGETNGVLPFYKRCVDLVGAILGIIFSSPIFLLAGIIIKLTSKGPVIFKQKAVGKDGKQFDYYKFRTMYNNSDNGSHKKFLAEFVKNSKPYTFDKNGQPVYKIVNDPRVTRIGKFLRRTSLDELPQLINVLKGDMSLVGPRPPLPYEYELYNERHKQRLTVPPGITGLYQITKRNVATFEEMVNLDLEYIKNRSLWLDIKIMLKTIPAMLKGNGAY